MDLRVLFNEKLETLQRLADERTEYSTIQSSAIVRHLLADNEPLALAINRKYKIKIRFKIGCAGSFEWATGISGRPPLVFSVEDGIVPDVIGGTGRSYGLLSLSEFLSLRVACAGRSSYTVLDIVKWSAHSLGGVHHTGSEDHASLNAASNDMRVMGAPVFLRLMRGISVVTLDALKALRYVSLADIAEELENFGNLEKSEAYFRKASSLSREVGRGINPDVAHIEWKLGDVLHKSGKYVEAEAYSRCSLEFFRSNDGDDHPQTIRVALSLGADLRFLGRVAEADEIHRDLLTRVPNIPEAQELIAAIKNNLAANALQDGRLEDATSLAARALAVWASVPNVLSASYAEMILGQVALELALWDLAVYHFSAVLTVRKLALPPGHPEVIRTMEFLSWAHVGGERKKEALDLIEGALEASELANGHDHATTKNIQARLEALRREWPPN